MTDYEARLESAQCAADRVDKDKVPTDADLMEVCGFILDLPDSLPAIPEGCAVVRVDDLSGLLVELWDRHNKNWLTYGRLYNQGYADGFYYADTLLRKYTLSPAPATDEQVMVPLEDVIGVLDSAIQDTDYTKGSTDSIVRQALRFIRRRIRELAGEGDEDEILDQKTKDTLDHAIEASDRNAALTGKDREEYMRKLAEDIANTPSDYKTRAEAVKAWNTRADSTEQSVSREEAWEAYGLMASETRHMETREMKRAHDTLRRFIEQDHKCLCRCGYCTPAYERGIRECVEVLEGMASFQRYLSGPYAEIKRGVLNDAKRRLTALLDTGREAPKEEEDE